MLTNQDGNKPSVVTADPAFEPDLFQEQICDQLGLSESVPAVKVIEQIVGDWIPVTPENQEAVNFLLSHVFTHEPKNIIEAQCIVQMMTCHQMCTSMMKKAQKETWPENAEKWLNSAVKLNRSFRAGMETLSKVRRNGEQRITIEKVAVEKDGSAIIGNVSSGKGG